MASIHGKISPVRVGFLIDVPTVGSDPTKDSDLFDPIKLMFEEAYADGRLERPVEFISRQPEGLPNGHYISVERAYDELVAEGCLLVFGPLTSENGVPLSAHVDEVAKVPCISPIGSELALGKWYFALNNGSLEEEPVILAAVLQHDGYKRVALATEASLIGDTYSRVFRRCAEAYGLKVVGEIDLPILEHDKAEAVKKLKTIDADVVVHLGLGLGLFGMTKAMHDIGWDPPRYSTTALEYAHVNRDTMRDMAGWIGLESYDERNEVGQAFLKHLEEKLGRKVDCEYLACYGRDVGVVMVQAIATAKPLTGKGVVEALEHVKFLPAASGGPGTKLRFGKQIRQGWMGAEYLIARRILPDGVGHVFHGSSEGTRGPVSPSAMDYPKIRG